MITMHTVVAFALGVLAYMFWMRWQAKKSGS